MKRTLPWLVLVAALLLHGFSVHGAWDQARHRRHGADFASYYYAVKVAQAGGDPYDTAALTALANAEKTRKAVYPFFYPPPFLLSMAWVTSGSLYGMYLWWFWLDEAFALACALVLWRWWRPLGDALPVVIAAVVATLTAVPNNHTMGQVNLPVMLLVLVGLWQEEQRRPALGGALVGVACMLKMSPALFVAWWMLRGRWRAVGAAVGTAGVVSLASLPIVPLPVQIEFYTQVLPGFGTGDYNGLTVPIGLFGNHAPAELLHALFPSGGDLLSPTARAVNGLLSLGLLVALGWAFRRPPATALARCAQISAVAVLALLVPVYTYEHHLVWTIPGLVVVTMAVLTGKAPRWWVAPLVVAWACLAWELGALRSLDRDLGGTLLLREVKAASLWLLLIATAILGTDRYGTA